MSLIPSKYLSKTLYFTNDEFSTKKRSISGIIDIPATENLINSDGIVKGLVVKPHSDNWGIYAGFILSLDNLMVSEDNLYFEKIELFRENK